MYLEKLVLLKIEDNDKIQICKFVNEINEDSDLNIIFEKIK